MLYSVFVDFVTDFDFSPFDDYLLSTCSHDGTVSAFALLIITNMFRNITFVNYTVQLWVIR